VKRYKGNSVTTIISYSSIRLSENQVWGDADDVTLLSNIYSNFSATDTTETLSNTVTIPAATIPGNYYILVKADHNDQISETNEDNNVAVLPVTIEAVAQHDLYIVNLESLTSPIQVGGTPTIKFTQRYKGNSVTTIISYSSIRLSENQVWGDADDVTLLPNIYSNFSATDTTETETNSVNIPIETIPGNYYILVKADHNDQVSETNEDNNVAVLPVTIEADAQHDLYIVNLESLTSPIQVGGSPTIRFAQRYKGNSVTTIISYSSIRLSENQVWGDADDVILLSNIYSDFSATDTTETETNFVTIPITTVPGNYYILVKADYNNQISEINEDNNVAVLPVTIEAVAQHDLYIVNLESLTSPIQVGGTPRIRFAARYKGNSSSSFVSYSAMRLSENQVWGDADDVILLSNIYSDFSATDTTETETNFVTIPITTVPGNYYILVKADYNNQISEINEDNNVAVLPVTIEAVAQHDLYIVNLESLTSPIQVGGTPRIRFAARYKGNSSSSFVSYSAMRLSENQVWGDADDVILLSNIYSDFSATDTTETETNSVTIPITTVPGNYYILVKADYNDQISETIEDNNVAILPVIIKPETKVIYPTATGIVWNPGTIYEITWQGFFDPYVKIELLKGGTLVRTITTATPNDGSMLWKVAFLTAGSDYKIRITSTATPTNTDVSDNNFTIEPLPNPQVIYPSSTGIVWNPGTIYTITWTGFTDPYVRIELLKGGTVLRTIASVRTNSGSMNWKVASLPVGNDYKIRITSTVTPSMLDESNNNFTIEPAASPMVTYPSATGIVWSPGTIYTITWQDFTDPYVKIELLKGGTLVRTITSARTNSGSMDWRVASTIAPGNDYKLRITSTANPAMTDESDNNFTIAGPPQVTYPSAPGICLGTTITSMKLPGRTLPTRM
jgi:subtilase family serine protease